MNDLINSVDPPERSRPAELARALEEVCTSCSRDAVAGVLQGLPMQKIFASLETKLTAAGADTSRVLGLLAERLPTMAGLDELIQQHSRLLEGFLNESVVRLFRAIIPVIDRLDSSAREFSDLNQHIPPSDFVLELQHLLDGVRTELLAVLASHGIEPFASGENLFTGKQHQAVGFVPCEDSARDGTICRVVKRGYRHDGVVLRPEVVEVYQYDKTSKQEID